MNRRSVSGKSALRADGSVLNWRDWPEQPGLAPIPAIEVVSLR